MQSMRMNAFFFSFVLFALSCSLRPKDSTDVAKSTDTLIATDNMSVSENLNKCLYGKLLFQVEVKKFFREGSINDIGNGETSLKYLMPVSFYKDSNYFYIPDRSRLSLRVLDSIGNFYNSINLPLKDFAFYKVEKNISDWYLLNIDKGLTVLDKDAKLKYRDEKTVDFHIDQPLNNLYIENTFNERRALLDQHGILKKPFEISYLNCFVNNSILSGISIYQDSIYSVIRWDMTKTSRMDSISLSTSCRNCFILPFFLNENYVLSSTDRPSLKDQLSVIDRSDLSVVTYVLEYPFKIRNLISDESAGYTYSGFIYFYERHSKILYSLCTDKDSIKIFSFDLNNLK